jgi:PAS domain S-box-containing protein
MIKGADLNSRVLILAPTGRDASATAHQVSAAGLRPIACAHVADLLARLDEGAGVAVIAEEAFRADLAKLTEWVEGQPTWSDFPFVVVTSRRFYPGEDVLRIRLLEGLGNVSFMERPLSGVSLISAVKSGLRARRRQLETHGILQDLAASEERLRLFIEHAPAALVMLDRDLRYLAVSRRWMKDYGLNENIIGRTHYEVFPEIPESWRESHRRCLAGATEHHPADRLVRSDGRALWLRREIRPWRDNRGQIGGLVISWEDITASKHAEERQQMLMREVLHRTKNLLAVIQAIAAGTFRGRDDPAQEAFLSRLHALSKAHGLITDESSKGAMLQDIVRGQLASFAGSISIEGPPVLLQPSAAQSFALVLHELATNAAKHGALSVSGGAVRVLWAIECNGPARKLRFSWEEHGGPSVVKPAHKGFGTLLLEHAIAGIDSTVTIEFAPTGLIYRTATPLNMLTPVASAADLERPSGAEIATSQR